MLKLSLIVTPLVVIIGLVVLLIVDREVPKEGASLRLINATGKTIKVVKVVVASKSCSANGVAANSELTCFFDKLSDSSYSVEVTLDSGVTYTGENLGYVTGGVFFIDEITIEASGEFKLERKVST